MNPIYNIWDYSYIEERAQHHQNQIIQVTDSARKLKEFLNSVDKVDQQYQGALTAECCAVLLEYAKKHNMI